MMEKLNKRERKMATNYGIRIFNELEKLDEKLNLMDFPDGFCEFSEIEFCSS
jgi:hypothetical protein